MATKNVGVILGYVDEQISLKNSHMVDFSCSKIGGNPEWCSGSGSTPSCTKCKRKMLFIIQVYAPLDGYIYHRTLYLFACVTPECWSKPHSWICLRSQLLDTRMSKLPIPPSPKPVVTSDVWLSDQDDWGSGDGDGNGNADNFSFTTPKDFLDNKGMAASHLQQSFNTSNIGANLNNINANTAAAFSDMAASFETQISLNEEYSNANESICGAVGVQANLLGGSEASALIEGPEGDMIAVESPEKPSSDIPALFKEATRIDSSSEVSFQSFFVASDWEPPEETAFSEHERELFLRYSHAAGQEPRGEDMGGGRGGGDGEGLYEKTSAPHGDVLLHKFKKRVLRSPQQILRYCRDDSASPLWLYPPHAGDHRRCGSCGGVLVFEMQVMPQLLNWLKIRGLSGAVLEFGTVAVYTCAASCWKDGDEKESGSGGVKTEAVVVQGEIF